MQKRALLAHVPEKWTPVFRKEHAPLQEQRSVSRSIRTGCALAVLLLCLPAGAAPVRGAEVAPAAPVAPFEAGLERLAEILGSLHYLRSICGANEGNKWRNEMQALMDAEAPSGQRRSQFIAHFNRGYRAYVQTYHSCTPAADLAVRRYLEEGSKIAREVTARYSN